MYLDTPCLIAGTSSYSSIGLKRCKTHGTVLGHVMVHEITHIIQGVSRHSDTGLMKPHWSSHDLTEMRYKPLPFAQEDLILLYSALAMTPGCGLCE